ncbi:MAG TPA: nuclear pore complex subunit [Bacteroidales bacterium]|nr:nuclear pore complex subunit [Bacteroidales bacterium]
MEKELLIKATNKTPSINFDSKTGLMQIHGYSLPENPFEFYEPIINWLDKYAGAPNKKTEFDFRMVMINTSSSKIFIDIIRKINKMVELNNSAVTVVWYYEIEDEDLHETAMQYQEVCKAPFKIIGTHHSLME